MTQKLVLLVEEGYRLLLLHRSSVQEGFPWRMILSSVLYFEFIWSGYILPTEDSRGICEMFKEKIYFKMF